MSNDKSRWVVVTLVLLSIVPIQCMLMWTRRDQVGGFDWLVLVMLCVLAVAHIDGPVPE